MPLEHLRIDAVRCLRDVSIDLDPRRNYLWGANGAGKTSCLEAIYLLARGRSFRGRLNDRLLQHGAEQLSVFGRVRDPAGRVRRMGVEFARGRLTTHLDGEPVPSQAALLRLLPVHVIDPRLHSLIEAGPNERRRFLDAGVFHVEHSFLDSWRAFRRLLGQRNAALKAGASDAELDIWSARFIEAANAVHRARSSYVDQLVPRIAEQSRKLLNEELRVAYRPGWRHGRDLSEVLDEQRPTDRQVGHTQRGPHRADLALGFDQGGVREIASRGQQKLVAAALVLGQVRLYEDLTGWQGMVLVDDVAAELDHGAQERLVEALDTLTSQQLLTGLSLEALNPDSRFPVFHVEQGRVVRMV